MKHRCRPRVPRRLDLVERLQRGRDAGRPALLDLDALEGRPIDLVDVDPLADVSPASLEGTTRVRRRRCNAPHPDDPATLCDGWRGHPPDQHEAGCLTWSSEKAKRSA